MTVGVKLADVADIEVLMGVKSLLLAKIRAIQFG